MRGELGVTDVAVTEAVRERLDCATALPVEYPYRFLAMVRPWIAPHR